MLKQNPHRIARTDKTVIGKWWWTIDYWLLISVGTLIAIGLLLIMAASPPKAAHLDLHAFYFVRKHLILLPVALTIMLSLSLFPPIYIRRIGVLSFIFFMFLLLITILFGQEVNGARRWLSIGGLSLQISEFVKPAFAIVIAWMFSSKKIDRSFPGNVIAIAIWALVVGMFMMQPDFGMTVLITLSWGTQFFLSGLRRIWITCIAVFALVAIITAYFSFSHIQSRVDRFFDTGSGDTYQIEKSLEAFENGGLFGRGPGEGRVKEVLPDAYTDFIFPVAGEEFGIFFCFFIVGIYGFIVLRGFGRLIVNNDLFTLLAGVGLLVQFGVQAFINMASSLHLIPTKGMTLPFISYGGSSLLALSFGMGMILALTRRQ